MLDCVSCYLVLLGKVHLQNFVHGLFTFLHTLISKCRGSLSILNDSKRTCSACEKWKHSEILANGLCDLRIAQCCFSMMV